MKKEKKFLHRMVFLYTLVFCAIFLVIMGLLYYILASSNREEARLNYQMLVNQPLKQLDRFFSEMDNVAYKVMTNEFLLQQFSMLQNEDNPENENHYETNILDSIDTATALAGVNSRITPVRRISAYNDKGDFISSGAIVDRKKAKEEIGRRREVTLLMARFRNPELNYLISRPQPDRWSDYFKSRYITLTRPIMNEYSRVVVGIVEVQQNLSVLEDYMRMQPEKPFSIDVYDENGEPVIRGGGDGDVVVATATSEAYHWRIDLLEPKSVMQTESLRLLLIMLLTWLSVSGVMLLVINLIARQVTRPLTDLAAAVRGTSMSELREIHVKSARIAEIEALETAFNQMMERLTLSASQEKKSFLLAMQAQMNPHFLFNVLSVINAMALENKSNVVVNICGNLSGMLRYSASYVKGVATVREELSHTVAYLDLMKSRYDYMFHYTVQIDDNLAEVVIPKLVIQPLCENCFTHAFADREPPYHMDIRIAPITGGWTISVTDNGAGFDDDVRLQILQRANNASYEDLNKMQIGGLGLVSSVVRLKLFTGRRIECDIRNASVGSTIIITIYDDKEVSA